MPEHKLTHEEADRRILEAMKPPEPTALDIKKLRELSEKQRTIQEQ